MRGLLVAGTTHAADVEAAGEALDAALRRSGEAPVTRRLHAHAATASPVTAARHEGASIDPAALVAELREDAATGPLVLTAPGGLLAPLTPRYALRDLAGELGLPLVLAVAAGPDLVSLARLSAESARGAGLAVAAVVLTGWPGQPDRVLLDERRLLDALADGVPVLSLPGDARSWPAAEWLDAAPARPAPPAPAAAAAPAPAAASVTLDPYAAWEGGPASDPRATPRPQIMAALLDIVAAEGPIRANRAYGLYNRAAGGRKLTSIARAPLSSAAYWLAREGRLVLSQGADGEDVLRLPDAPAVHVRELGPRTLEEVPLDEIAELMRRLGLRDGATLKRAVLDRYGLVRLTTRADELLEAALGLLTAG